MYADFRTIHDECQDLAMAVVKAFEKMMSEKKS
jgi:hypothetical protein